MPDITRIQIANEPERSYKDFPVNREFKKRAEDENSGGGGWPSDLPKPSEGGYGYSEGDMVSVTWDGDITGIESVEIYPGATLYLIREGYIEIERMKNASISVSESSEILQIPDDQWVFYVRDSIYTPADLFPTLIVAKAGSYSISDREVTVPKDGIYVLCAEFEDDDGTIRKEWVSKFNFDDRTVHKINPKYIPKSTDTVIEFNWDEDGNEWVADPDTIPDKIDDPEKIVFKFLTDVYDEMPGFFGCRCSQYSYRQIRKAYDWLYGETIRGSKKYCVNLWYDAPVYYAVVEEIDVEALIPKVVHVHSENGEMQGDVAWSSLKDYVSIGRHVTVNYSEDGTMGFSVPLTQANDDGTIYFGRMWWDEAANLMKATLRLDRWNHWYRDE